MNDDAIAAKVAQEHTKLVGIIKDLQGAAAAIPVEDRPAWLDRLRDQFFRFRAHMIHRIALEEVGGFLTRVVEVRPALAKDVEHLRRENRDILASVEQVHQSLGDTGPDDADRLRRIRLRIQRILSAVQHHTEHEDLLIGFVHRQDSGGES